MARVTLVVRHRVRPDKQAEFEDWLRGITREVLQCKGTLGSNVVRPTDPRKLEYLVFLRFDSFANLERWEESEVRRQWLDRLDELTLQAPTRKGTPAWRSGSRRRVVVPAATLQDVRCHAPGHLSADHLVQLAGALAGELAVRGTGTLVSATFLSA